MSRSGSQQRTLIGILGTLRPYWHRDPALPARIESLLRGDRRFGSRDRRLYRELVYTALRYLPWIETLLDSDLDEAVRRIAWLAPDAGAASSFRADVAGGMPPCPVDAAGKAKLLDAHTSALVPEWFRGECPELETRRFLDVMLSRAPLWVRLQTDRPDVVFDEFRQLGWSWRESPALKGALALPQDSAVERTESYRRGAIEIQDIGSQLVLKEAEVAQGARWLDACAGAGGKTLQLASLVGSDGRVTARDSRRTPLEELRVRSARAGLAGRICVGVREDPPGGFDGVLVDAPCSGSGTWRRSPHLKWTTSAADVQHHAEVQLRLLHENLPRVRPGGILVYSTCSLCTRENESVVAEFLQTAQAVSPVKRATRILPSVYDGDGFFVASFRRLPT